MNQVKMHPRSIMLAALFCCTLPLSTVAVAGQGLGIKGSIHDFSSREFNTTKEICRVCHAPHDKQHKNYEAGLLWNRKLSTKTYTPYSSGSLGAESTGQPVGLAKMCLGCHDGTVALNAFDGYVGDSDGMGLLPNRYKIGSALTGFSLYGTHPISIQYKGNRKVGLPGGLRDPENTYWVYSDGITIARTLDDGLVQCPTCHDVHDRVAVAGTPLLRAPMQKGQAGSITASSLCLTCHDK